MIQKIKKFIIMGMAAFAMLTPSLVVVPLAAGGVAYADIKASLCEGADAAAAADNGKSACDKTTGTAGESGLKTLAKNVTNLFSIIVGAIAIIMIIYGGFRYITSGGDSSKVGNAKNTLIYALVGLIIVALAQLIVRFVLTQTDQATLGA